MPSSLQRALPWAVVRNQQNVAERVVVKVGHRVEERGEGLAVSGFKLLDEVLHVFADELLRGGGLPVITAGSRIDGG